MENETDEIVDLKKYPKEMEKIIKKDIYIGTEVIKACKMNYLHFCLTHGQSGLGMIDEEGYIIKFADESEKWLNTEEFEKKYRKLDGKLIEFVIR